MFVFKKIPSPQIVSIKYVQFFYSILPNEVLKKKKKSRKTRNYSTLYTLNNSQFGGNNLYIFIRHNGYSILITSPYHRFIKLEIFQQLKKTLNNGLKCVFEGA